MKIEPGVRKVRFSVEEQEVGLNMGFFLEPWEHSAFFVVCKFAKS